MKHTIEVNKGALSAVALFAAKKDVRYYLRGVEQVDLATRERHARLPGMPLGGTTWRERS